MIILFLKTLVSGYIRKDGSYVAPHEDRRIKRILSVRDTRAYVEEGDRFVPVPGSGETNTCARCGRGHEVHATVELHNGETAVVGESCAKTESAEMDRKIKNRFTAEKAMQAVRRRHAKLLDDLAAYDREWNRVSALHPPAMERTGERTSVGEWWKQGDSRVQVWDGQLVGGLPSAERIRTLHEGWVDNRMVENGHPPSWKVPTMRAALHDAGKKIERLQAQISGLDGKP